MSPSPPAVAVMQMQTPASQPDATVVCCKSGSSKRIDSQRFFEIAVIYSVSACCTLVGLNRTAATACNQEKGSGSIQTSLVYFGTCVIPLLLRNQVLACVMHHAPNLCAYIPAYVVRVA